MEQTLSSERIPPQAIEVERAVLGAILLEKTALDRIANIIRADAFYRDAHSKIFRVMLSLYEQGEPIDILTVAEGLTKAGHLEEIGGRAYLASLLECVATSAHIEHHAKLVLEKATLRALITSATEIVGRCYDATEEVDDLLDRVESRIFSIKESMVKLSASPLAQILPQTFEMIEEYHKRGGNITGLATGFEELDTLTAGFQPADFIVIAGRPSMGKTAFVLTMAEHIGISGEPVAIFSLEMSKNQLAQRMLCSRARVSSHRMRTGRLADHEWANLSIAVGPLSEAKVFIDDTPNMDVLELRAKARRLRAQHNISLVVIDYLQLMQGPRAAENRQQEISMISRSLKGLAKELNVPVVALSQLSRQVEVRGGSRKPQLADLRESGAIEQDADVVMFIYRPELYGIQKFDDGVPTEHVAEIIIAKQRNGPTGTIRLSFIRDFARFENLTLVEHPVPF